MVSPKEIMKGAILSYEGIPQIVKSIGEYIMFEGKKEWIGPSLVRGEFISMTWLEKFNFEQTSYDSFSNGLLEITLGEHLFTCNYSKITYQYVHQLQLLHFALIGEHLKIPKLK